MTEEQAAQTISPPESQPQPTDLPQPTPEPQQTKPNKGLMIGLAAFALIALGIAGVFAYQNYQLKQKTTPKKDMSVPTPVPTLIPLPSPSVIPSPTPTPQPEADHPLDETANWLTLPNKDVCYTFKYPKDITFQERKEENIIHLSLWGPTQEKDTEFYDGISLSFSLPLQIGNTSLKDYVDSKIEESKQFGEILKPRSEITVNGIKGYTYTSEGLGIFQNIYLQSPDKTCTVEITNATNDPTNQGFQETVNKILATFNFIK